MPLTMVVLDVELLFQQAGIRPKHPDFFRVWFGLRFQNPFEFHVEEVDLLLFQELFVEMAHAWFDVDWETYQVDGEGPLFLTQIMQESYLILNRTGLFPNLRKNDLHRCYILSELLYLVPYPGTMHLFDLSWPVWMLHLERVGIRPSYFYVNRISFSSSHPFLHFHFLEFVYHDIGKLTCKFMYYHSFYEFIRGTATDVLVCLRNGYVYTIQRVKVRGWVVHIHVTGFKLVRGPPTVAYSVFAERLAFETPYITMENMYRLAFKEYSIKQHLAVYKAVKHTTQ